jgi:hypothetical protein
MFPILLQLLNLGHLLRVGGEDPVDEEGRVFKLVAQAALKVTCSIYPLSTHLHHGTVLSFFC